MKANLSMERIMEAAQADDNRGFCRACGEEHNWIEPDAERYECEVCGEKEVYGAEQLLLCFY